ncbi:hypothetical protein [Pyxidicoccus trucidator]|uniref:hypothetical protein n=1 Tax=Pyxidicoccus trucidator TaxID=2709662 RepID=UPI0013D9ECCF|nr:hypothetical protein [Pyxidicoccus trucidator]
MRCFAVSLLLVVSLSACATPREPPASECPRHELAFSRETGCQNDGAVEFCLPKGNDALLARVKAIAPKVHAGASRGRAGCDTSQETLYFFPTEATECVSHHGALTPAAWDALCRLAALPEVRAIVPTWYE